MTRTATRPTAFDGREGRAVPRPSRYCFPAAARRPAACPSALRPSIRNPAWQRTRFPDALIVTILGRTDPTEESQVRNTRRRPGTSGIDARLVSFDLDGTLFPDTTTCLALGRLLGHLELIRDLEDRYARFEIGNAEVAEQDAGAYRGRSVAKIEQAVLQIPLIGGFHETVRALKARGPHVLVVTVAWSFAARALARAYGLDGFAGAEMGEAGGFLTGTVARHFEASDKVRFVRDYAGRHGFGLSHCVAVGDSRSDIPLFREAGLAIALNATEQARAVADVCVDTRDLTDILPLIHSV